MKQPTVKLAFMALALTGSLIPLSVSAQITNVVFSDDFSKNGIDTNRYAVDSPFFEGGQGTIAPKVENGVLEFTGEVSQRWWAGATLRVLQTFPASDETNVVVTVDRVAENGEGSASRSALWIMDETKTKYVLYADVRGEGGWHYNRKIGVSGDTPTGGGPNIGPFDGVDAVTGIDYDDQGQHQMQVVANGKTVRLYLDGKFGISVQFPFSPIVVQLGSYARNGPPDPSQVDTANTIWDNLKIETVGAAAFSITNLTMVSGQTATDVTVRIPAGVNQTKDVQVKVTSSEPTIAIPTGATGGSLTLTFAAGGPREQSLSVQSLGPSGLAVLTLTNDLGMAAANNLRVVVVEGAGVRLTEDFSGTTIDTSKWTKSEVPFEVGVGTFEVNQTGGQLVINGTIDQEQYWDGASLKTAKGYTATPVVPLSFEVDRVSIDPMSIDGATPSTGARTGVFITTADRSQYVLLAQNVGETGWQVNVNPGNPTGSGTALAAFSAITNNANHRMKLVADGSTVEVFLDGVSGGKFPFAVNGGIYFELGAYARALGDAVNGVFDNVKIENILPPIQVNTIATDVPNRIITPLGVNTNLVTITIPRFLNATKAVSVSITSQDPNVAVPEGAVNGTLALPFPVGAATVQSVKVTTVGVGSTTFTVTNDQATAVANTVLPVRVTSPMTPVFTDNFSSGVDTNANWVFDTTALDTATPGTLTADSGVAVTNGMLNMAVVVETGNWPGVTLKTVKKYNATETSPIWFEVDRVRLGFQLVTGTGAQQRTGVWVYDATGENYVFFDEYLTHSGTIQGWQYNRLIGQTGDITVPAAGTGMSAFAAAAFNDQGNHHIRIVVNGTEAILYLDGIYGATVPFPFGNNLSFGIGTYVAAATDTANGFFDNVVISGPGTIAPTIGPLSVAKQGANVVISWTGAGTLQSSATVTGGWTDVSPAPTGTSFTVTPTAQAQQFYRLRQ